MRYFLWLILLSAPTIATGDYSNAYLRGKFPRALPRPNPLFKPREILRETVRILVSNFGDLLNGQIAAKFQTAFDVRLLSVDYHQGPNGESVIKIFREDLERMLWWSGKYLWCNNDVVRNLLQVQSLIRMSHQTIPNPILFRALLVEQYSCQC